MPHIALLKGSGKSQPSIHIFSDTIFKCPELTVAAVAAGGEDSSKEVGHPSHFVCWPDPAQRITPNMDSHVQHDSKLKPVLKAWSQLLCHGYHTRAFAVMNQTTNAVVLGKISQHCYSHIHSSSLLSDVLALGHRGYKGHQINKHNFFSHANFITVVWGDCERFLCLAASYGKRTFSIVLKQKQRKQNPNFTLEERPKDSWHSYFRVSCSILLILQELPMENMEKKAVFPSRRVSLTEQASTRSRNQSAKEHQGLCCVTLGV